MKIIKVYPFWQRSDKERCYKNFESLNNRDKQNNPMFYFV